MSIYQNYLYDSSQVLNEMYYGKHPYLKMIEKYFAEVKKIISESISLEPPETKVVGDIDNLPDFIKRKLKKQEESMGEAASITDEKYSNFTHKMMSNLLRSSKLATVALSPPIDFPEYTEEDLNKLGYREVALKLSKPLVGLGGFPQYFEPHFDRKDYYINLVKNICEAWSGIFKFPGVTFDILTIETPNAFYFPAHSFNDKRSLDFVKDKPVALSKWFNKNRLYEFGSTNNSIYFKKFTKIPVHIFVTAGLLDRLQPDEILAILLHEIGHSFGMRLLPIEYIHNEYVQEKFADAFATKFGYGVELARALKKLGKIVTSAMIAGLYSSLRKSMRIVMPDLTQNSIINEYLKFKLMLGMLVTKYDKTSVLKKGFLDPHPTMTLRRKEQLEHLMIELNNPRLNNLQKRQLKSDIALLKKELGITSHEPIDKLSADIDRELEKAPGTRKGELNSKQYLNPKIIKDILDKIYDDSMGNI